MYQHETRFRVRYGETDRMGYVYYGNYATYYEVGRVEALRSLGFSYRSLEDSGVLLPVSDFSVRYRKPAYYDVVGFAQYASGKLCRVRTRYLCLAGQG